MESIEIAGKLDELNKTMSRIEAMMYKRFYEKELRITIRTKSKNEGGGIDIYAYLEDYEQILELKIIIKDIERKRVLHTETNDRTVKFGIYDSETSSEIGDGERVVIIGEARTHGKEIITSREYEINWVKEHERR